MNMHFFLLQATSQGIDWNMLLFGEHSWNFVLEVMLRSTIMFIVSLTTMRLLGKRGVKERLFEIVVIITLGSAAGDAMFYKDVGLIPAITVFVMIILLYKICGFLVVKSKWFDRVIEGKPVVLIRDGAFNYEVYRKQLVSQDEFFSELRVKSVSHLGQVRLAYLEDSGEISLFFYSDEEVKYGLPIFPVDYEKMERNLVISGMVSCVNCGFTQEAESHSGAKCMVCSDENWILSSNEERIK